MRALLALLVMVVLATSAEAAPWARRGGGSLADVGQAVVVDASGNTIVTGALKGSANFGGGVLTSAGWGDVVLAKYTPAGMLLWSKRLGGTQDDRGYAVAIDPSADCDGAGGTNCIVVAGVFRLTGSFGGTPFVSAGKGDIFVAKYSSVGTHLWSHGFGGVDEDAANGVAVDASGNVLVTGVFFDSASIGGAVLTSPNRDPDMYVAKFSPTGAHLWSENFWNTGADTGRAIAVNSSGDVLVAGSFAGSINFGTGPKSSTGADDIFVAKLDGTDGSGVWANRYGGGASDSGYGIAIDSSGNVAVTGAFSTAGGESVSFGGTAWVANGLDIFLAQFNGTTGAHIWSRRCTGTYTTTRRSYGVATDPSGNVVITGLFGNTIDFGLGSVTAVGAADIFVAKYTAAGTPTWAEHFGGAGAFDTGYGITTDPTNSEVLMTGLFQGRLNVGGQAFISAGADDVFLLRLAP
jgi:hypothetical protein